MREIGDLDVVIWSFFRGILGAIEQSQIAKYIEWLNFSQYNVNIKFINLELWRRVI